MRTALAGNLACKQALQGAMKPETPIWTDKNVAGLAGVVLQARLMAAVISSNAN